MCGRFCRVCRGFIYFDFGTLRYTNRRVGVCLCQRETDCGGGDMRVECAFFVLSKGTDKGVFRVLGHVLMRPPDGRRHFDVTMVALVLVVRAL